MGRLSTDDDNVFDVDFWTDRGHSIELLFCILMNFILIRGHSLHLIHIVKSQRNFIRYEIVT